MVINIQGTSPTHVVEEYYSPEYYVDTTDQDQKQHVSRCLDVWYQRITLPIWENHLGRYPKLGNQYKLIIKEEVIENKNFNIDDPKLYLPDYQNIIGIKMKLTVAYKPFGNKRKRSESPQ